MRILSLSILLSVLVAAPSVAQDARLSFELAGGRSATSDIFSHEVVMPESVLPAGTSVIRLSIGDGSIASARLAYRVAGPWTLIGALGQGSASYYYLQSFSGPILRSLQEQRGSARRTTFGLGVARRSTFATLPLFLEPELGFAIQRLRVGDPPAECVPTPPTPGGSVNCVAIARWERTYSVPSVGGGLSVGYAIAPNVAVELRGQYSVGRTSTKEGFYVDLLPQYDWAEAPKSQTIRSSQVSVGLRIAP